MHDANVMIGANVITDQRATKEEPIYKRALAQNLEKLQTQWSDQNLVLIFLANETN